MGVIFFEITVIICLAAVLSVVFKFLKQPEILAYILTGIIIGPLGFLRLQSQDFLQTLAELGITFLLFMMGLEIKLRDFPSIGIVALMVSAGQIVFSFLIGYFISIFLGFPQLTAIYLGIALTLSSTVIVVKILSDKREIHSLYAKIVVGVLIIQDFLAILILMSLSSFTSHALEPSFFIKFIEVIIKAALIFGIVWYLGGSIFPKLLEKLAKSQETLFLVSIAWLFGLSALVSSKLVGFSLEIGGFLAGLSLANSIANYQIIARARILRDFFIVIFFVLLGIQMRFGNISVILLPAIVLSLFVLLIKPLILMLIMGILGYKKRTSFLTGISLSQVSEFSLIIIFLGARLGQIDSSVVSLITLVAIITFAMSAYIMVLGKKLYGVLGPRLSFLELARSKKEEVFSSNSFPNLKDHVVLIGGDQMGQGILEALEDMDRDIVVVDFDPDIVKRLESKKVHRLFGDIGDLDIQKLAQINNAKLVISTIPEVEDNLFLIRELNKNNRTAKIVVMALDSLDAKVLYKAGADYVVLPHLAGGRQIAKMLSEDKLDKIEGLKLKDISLLG